jgi:dGTPase
VLRDRRYFEQEERRRQAAYAVFSDQCRGRAYDEPEHELRPPFQRDRDRIIHSTAFRRLEYKTQVFVNHEGDYYRTRLTHTMETAQVTRTIARALGLNEELAETVALAHDLGHTPFGHAGEHILDGLMADFGGFEHNSQSLRIVEVLEERYPNFPGLNLTYEVREGIVKHSTRYDRPRVADFDATKAPPLEAQIVDFCDEVAYNSHDIDDGLQSGMLTLEDLDGIRLWERAFADVQKKIPNGNFSILRYQTVRAILDGLVRDLVDSVEKRIADLGVETLEDVRSVMPRLVEHSPEMATDIAALKARLMDRLYSHQRVRRMAGKAKHVMSGIFRAYMDDPRQMPEHILDRAQGDVTMPRVIADYIAGMTDRFALEEYAKLYDPLERV